MLQDIGTAPSNLAVRYKRMGYLGGKGGHGVYQTLINLMPPHHVYVEAFLGSGAVMAKKRPARVNIGIELNKDVASAFSAVAAVTIINGDARSELPKMKLGPRDLVYCDPPYPKDVRTCPRTAYPCDMTDDDHWKLIKVLTSLRCMVMVSAYDSPIYEQGLAGWRREAFVAYNQRKQAVLERVYLNFPVPTELHDYRYLGRNYRERENIKKRIDRLKIRMAAMDRMERYAMIAALDGLRGDNAPPPLLFNWFAPILEGIDEFNADRVTPEPAVGERQPHAPAGYPGDER